MSQEPAAMRCPNDDLDRLADSRDGQSWEEHLRRLGFGVGPGLEDRTRALEIRDVLAGAMCHTRAGVAVGVRPVAGGVEIVFLRRSGRAWAAAAVRAVVEPAGLIAVSSKEPPVHDAGEGVSDAEPPSPCAAPAARPPGP